MSQVKDLADQVIQAVKSYISKSLAELTARVEQFETKLAGIPAPLKGDPGEPGKNAEITDEQLAKAVTDYVIANPIPVPSDGKSVTVDDVLPLLRAELEKAVDTIPQPKDGEAGPQGERGGSSYDIAASLGFEGDVYAYQESLRGEKGADGKSVTADEVLPVLTAELKKAIDDFPRPRDGVDGKSVATEDFRSMFEAEQAKWALEFERRAFDILQKAFDRMPVPKDGRDGVDGLGFESFEPIYDGERTVTFKFVRDEIVKDFVFTLPIPIDRGVFRHGESYERGDTVSYGGSIWIAQRATDSKPEKDDSWRLSVKRGRDGKDGAPGQKGDPGPSGKAVKW